MMLQKIKYVLMLINHGRTFVSIHTCTQQHVFLSYRTWPGPCRTTCATSAAMLRSTACWAPWPSSASSGDPSLHRTTSALPVPFRRWTRLCFVPCVCQVPGEPLVRVGDPDESSADEHRPREAAGLAQHAGTYSELIKHTQRGGTSPVLLLLLLCLVISPLPPLPPLS